MKTLLSLSLILCLCVLSVAAARSQPAKVPASPRAPAKRVTPPGQRVGLHRPQGRPTKAVARKRRVMITGSLIPRKPGTLLASPVITLKRREIRRNGHTTLCGALRDVPAITVNGC